MQQPLFLSAGSVPFSVGRSGTNVFYRQVQYRCKSMTLIEMLLIKMMLIGMTLIGMTLIESGDERALDVHAKKPSAQKFACKPAVYTVQNAFYTIWGLCRIECGIYRIVRRENDLINRSGHRMRYEMDRNRALQGRKKCVAQVTYFFYRFCGIMRWHIGGVYLRERSRYTAGEVC